MEVELILIAPHMRIRSAVHGARKAKRDVAPHPAEKCILYRRLVCVGQNRIGYLPALQFGAREIRSRAGGVEGGGISWTVLVVIRVRQVDVFVLKRVLSDHSRAE